MGVARGAGEGIETPLAGRLLEEIARIREPAESELPPQPPRVSAKVAPQVQTEKGNEREPAKKGRGIMKLKWFAGDGEETFGANGSANPSNETAQRVAEAAPRSERGSERGMERA